MKGRTLTSDGTIHITNGVQPALKSHNNQNILEHCQAASSQLLRYQI